jgi:hypothetical protein
VRAVCRGEVPVDLHSEVRHRADELLDQLPLARQPRLKVTLRSDGGPR